MLHKESKTTEFYLAILTAALTSLEQGRVDDAQGLSSDFRGYPMDIVKAYVDSKRKDFNSLRQSINEAKSSVNDSDLRGYSSYYSSSSGDQPLYKLLLGLIDLAEVRALLEVKKPGVALSRLVRVTSRALKPVVLLYMAEAYEQMNNDVAAYMAYSEVLKLIDSPLVKSRLTFCCYPSIRPSTSAQSRPLAKVAPINVNPDAFVGKTIGPYSVERKIGSGGFGYVYLGKIGNKKFAIKVLRLEKGDPMAYFQELFHEANNLSNLSGNPNIVKLHAIYIDLNVITHALSGDLSLYYANPPMIVMEFMEGGSLDRYLYEDTFFYSSNWERAVIKAAKQVADALSYIHSRGYVYLDVKPQNVFLPRKPVDPSDLPNVDFKLGDLGSVVRADNRLTQVTPEYYPPEIYVDNAKPSMDVFALGITLYVLLSRKNDRPDLQAMNEAYDCYVNNDMNCVKQKVDEAKKSLASWDPQVQEPYKSIIKKMIDPDPMKRPTADEVVKELSKIQP